MRPEDKIGDLLIGPPRDELFGWPVARPDGLTRREINALVWEAHAAARRAVPLTSAVADGSAAESRAGREARRAIARIARAGMAARVTVLVAPNVAEVRGAGEAA
jgi:hypothetical protein